MNRSGDRLFLDNKQARQLAEYLEPQRGWTRLARLWGHAYRQRLWETSEADRRLQEELVKAAHWESIRHDASASSRRARQ